MHVTTTARYERPPEEAERKAAALLHYVTPADYLRGPDHVQQRLEARRVALTEAAHRRRACWKAIEHRRCRSCHQSTDHDSIVSRCLDADGKNLISTGAERFHECPPGRRKLAVKVVDIFGNDTVTIVEVRI